jgi:hypothetical protein
MNSLWMHLAGARAAAILTMQAFCGARLAAGGCRFVTKALSLDTAVIAVSFAAFFRGEA